MCQKVILFVVILTFAGLTNSQTVSPTKTDENDVKLKKEAVEFLRETAAEAGRLRTAENRISFNAELASLMWFQHEKEARAMYGSVVNEFKQLLTQLDMQMNLPVVDDDDAASGGFLFGSYGKSRAERKLRIAMMVRQQIAMSLAEHAPDLAYNFYYDSINLITNAAFRKEIDQTDKYFESRLLTQIAESDATKAIDYGKESIKRGLETHHIELLKKIYAKDVDKGVEFGGLILDRLKNEKKDRDDIYFYNSLLSFGTSNLETSRKSGGKKAVYSQDELRDIADQFAQLILSEPGERSYMYSIGSYADQIEKYSPSRAMQIRAKFKVALPASNIRTTRLGTAANTAVRSMSANSNSADDAERVAREEREKREKQMIADVMSLGKKELPKEERAKIIGESRKIISQTPGKDKKIVALSLLATQVAKAGDKELADEIMRDAERMVNPEPKNYQDFMLNWMLASGYAEANPDKAFPILETTILRANETISAFIKVAEFIDVNAEIIDDGEVQVGMFGGEMIRGMTRELGMAAAPLRTLARADFEKTRNLTNVFDRTETRVLAKMLVLRAVLDNKQKDSRIDQSQIVLEGKDINEPDPLRR